MTNTTPRARPPTDAANNAHPELTAQLDNDAEQLAEFIAAKDRLRDRVVAARADLAAFRVAVAETRADFMTQLDDVRRQVAPLLPPSRSPACDPAAPPSTPAG